MKNFKDKDKVKDKPEAVLKCKVGDSQFQVLKAKVKAVDEEVQIWLGLCEVEEEVAVGEEETRNASNNEKKGK